MFSLSRNGIKSEHEQRNIDVIIYSRFTIITTDLCDLFNVFTCPFFGPPDLVFQKQMASRTPFNNDHWRDGRVVSYKKKLKYTKPFGFYVSRFAAAIKQLSVSTGTSCDFLFQPHSFVFIGRTNYSKNSHGALSPATE